MAPRETENNAYAKFWGDKQRTLWYVMVFLEWSIFALASASSIRDLGTTLYRQVECLKYLVSELGHP